MTIYRIYADNGDRAGFWVQHRKWTDRCAQVQSIDGRKHGQLPGAAPDHCSAQISFRWYDVRSGRELPAQPVLENCQDKNYATIATPWWSRSDAPRPVRMNVSSGGSKAF